MAVIDIFAVDSVSCDFYRMLIDYYSIFTGFGSSQSYDCVGYGDRFGEDPDKARGKYEGRFMGGRSGDDIQRFAVYSGADQHVAIYRDKCLHDADRGCRIL